MDKVESGSIDAFSSLPVLAHILSFLPTKRAVYLSVLSKRWKNMFTLMISCFASQHHLQFDDTDLLYPKETKQSKDHARSSFRALVDKTLSLQHQQDGGECNKSLNKFSLICEDDHDHFRTHTSRWISNVLKRGVTDFDLRITVALDRNCLIPSIVFTSKTLVKLTLGTRLCVGELPIGEVCLPMLKSLFLYTFWFVDRDFTDFIVRGCPVLEELYIYHKYNDYHDGIDQTGAYDFCHPTIKRITIHRSGPYYITGETRRLAFNTPNLVYLDYSNRVVSYGYDSANFLDSLLEARFDLLLPRFVRFEPQKHLKFISWICNVLILHLSFNTVELMLLRFHHWRNNGGFPVFENLVSLSTECKTKKGWKVLWSLIKNSPKLETLTLKGYMFSIIRSRGAVSIDGNVVKVLKICGYTGTVANCYNWNVSCGNLSFFK